MPGSQGARQIHWAGTSGGQMLARQSLLTGTAGVVPSTSQVSSVITCCSQADGTPPVCGPDAASRPSAPDPLVPPVHEHTTRSADKAGHKGRMRRTNIIRLE